MCNSLKGFPGCPRCSSSRRTPTRASIVGPDNPPEPDRVAEHKPLPGPEPKRVAGPFTGLFVIDLTHVLNGPFGTTILSDLGARIIKIEPPGHGDDTRTFGPFYKGQPLYYSFVTRGKESIVLNLKQDDDGAVFLNMVQKADVLTENFRPGAMDRLGFSYEVLSKLNPRLIYASSTGFGQTRPLKTFPGRAPRLTTTWPSASTGLRTMRPRATWSPTSRSTATPPWTTVAPGTLTSASRRPFASI